MLINVFIAIVSNSYDKAKNEYKGGPTAQMIALFVHPFTWLSNPFYSAGVSATSVLHISTRRASRAIKNWMRLTGEGRRQTASTTA